MRTPANASGQIVVLLTRDARQASAAVDLGFPPYEAPAGTNELGSNPVDCRNRAENV